MEESKTISETAETVSEESAKKTQNHVLSAKQDDVENSNVQDKDILIRDDADEESENKDTAESLKKCDTRADGKKEENSRVKEMEKGIEKEPQNMNAKELRMALKSYGLKSTGLKSVLLERLQNYESNAENASNDSSAKKMDKDNNDQECGMKRKSSENLESPKKLLRLDKSSTHIADDINIGEGQTSENNDVENKDRYEQKERMEVNNNAKRKNNKKKNSGGNVNPDVADLKKMKLPEIKSKLAARGLSTKGYKSDLLEALSKAIEKEGKDEVGGFEETNTEINKIAINNETNIENATKKEKKDEEGDIEEIAKTVTNKVGDPEESVGSSKQKKVKSGREIKSLSNGQYSDMNGTLPNGAYDFGESPVLVMNSSGLKNGVNFHISKTVLPEPAIPKDVLEKLLFKSGLKRNEIAITCGLSAEKAFQKNHDKDGTGTQFLRDIDPSYVTSDGLPNIIKCKKKKKEKTRDAFTLTFPHTTYATANEVVTTLLKQTRSNDLRNVLKAICDKNKGIEEGQDRAVISATSEALKEDLENQNEENFNWLSDEGSSGSESEISPLLIRPDPDDAEGSEKRSKLVQKMTEIVRGVEIIPLEKLYDQVSASEEDCTQADFNHAVEVMEDLEIAVYNKNIEKLEYIQK